MLSSVPGTTRGSFFSFLRTLSCLDAASDSYLGSKARHVDDSPAFIIQRIELVSKILSILGAGVEILISKVNWFEFPSS